MINSPLIQDLIFKGDVHGIKGIMKKSRELGMQTFDMALFELYEAGKISYEDAMRNADSMNELRLRIKLEGLRRRIARRWPTWRARTASRFSAMVTSSATLSPPMPGYHSRRGEPQAPAPVTLAAARPGRGSLNPQAAQPMLEPQRWTSPLFSN